jgi:AraC-like DNA-binding protein
MAYQNIDPGTRKPARKPAEPKEDTIQLGLSAAHALFESEWSKGSAPDRLAILTRLADLIDQRSEELALELVNHMGKRLAEARWELRLTAEVARYYACNADTFQAPKIIQTSHGETRVEYHAVGVVVATEPLNLPYYQLICAAAPNIAVGNPVLAKHASIMPQAVVAFEKLLRAAGAPAGAWINLSTTDEIASLVADGRVQGLALTGSELAGNVFAARAAKTHGKPILELGNTDVFPVLSDADLVTSDENGAIAHPEVRSFDARLNAAVDRAHLPKRSRIIDDRRLQRVFDYVDANLVRKITVEDLASVAALSRFHFSRRFKAMTGHTPNRFVGRRRLELAKALFAEGLSITQIALECGFSSESNFGRFFRKETGVTPGHYRRTV